MRVLSGIICAVVVAQSVMAADRGEFATAGVGNVSCGRFSEARATKRHEEAFVNWVGGYVTAYNAHMPVYNIIGSTDLHGFVGWLDKYCRENPTDDFFTAVFQGIKFIEPKAQLTKPGR